VINLRTAKALGLTIPPSGCCKPEPTAIRTMTVPTEGCGKRGYERATRVPGCGQIGLSKARSAHRPYPTSYTTSWDAISAECARCTYRAYKIPIVPAEPGGKPPRLRSLAAFERRPPASPCVDMFCTRRPKPVTEAAACRSNNVGVQNAGLDHSMT
jgi:hypothetical protein